MKDFKEYMKAWGIILLIIIIMLAIEYKYGIIKKAVNAKPKESNYSPAEYANYPNLTGNPVADIAILNQAGFKADHS